MLDRIVKTIEEKLYKYEFIKFLDLKTDRIDNQALSIDGQSVKDIKEQKAKRVLESLEEQFRFKRLARQAKLEAEIDKIGREGVSSVPYLVISGAAFMGGVYSNSSMLVVLGLAAGMASCMKLFKLYFMQSELEGIRGEGVKEQKEAQKTQEQEQMVRERESIEEVQALNERVDNNTIHNKYMYHK